MDSIKMNSKGLVDSLFKASKEIMDAKKLKASDVPLQSNERNKYIACGVKPNKIVVSKLPSVCVWSLSRKCLVGENGVEFLELIDDGSGNFKLSGENNRMVYTQIVTEIDVDKINDSNGIIVSECTSHNYFRFGFIPTN